MTIIMLNSRCYRNLKHDIKFKHTFVDIGSVVSISHYILAFTIIFNGIAPLTGVRINNFISVITGFVQRFRMPYFIKETNSLAKQVGVFEVIKFYMCTSEDDAYLKIS